MEYVRTTTLGDATVPSPLRRSTVVGDGVAKYVTDDCFVRYSVELGGDSSNEPDLAFEKAGPRQRLFFNPAATRAAIVTCGGLCPGLNNVIRSAFLELHKNHGVNEVFGIRYGYQGLSPTAIEPPLRLTMDIVDDIHEEGGTILGSSRGSPTVEAMVDFLVAQRINILFCVGGDGTQRGAHAIFEESQRRGLKIAIVGIPKTIDNDVEYCTRTFGYTTAVAEAERVLACAHVEAKGAINGIGLVKVMGRDAGFIAAGATLASQESNFTLIPEVPFALDGDQGFLKALHRRILARHHALIVVAEGAGQDLFAKRSQQRDASGNVLNEDIGLLLKQEIIAYFEKNGPKVALKYIDPSYIVRSVPANCEDDVLCDQYARHAVHAAMAGKTDIIVGHVSGMFVYVPITMAIAKKRHLRVEGEFWNSVLAATGQPQRFF
jgi:6-phosphofructokinase 1